MDLTRLNEAMWNYYKIQDQLEIIADVKQQLSSPPKASTSATTGNSLCPSTNSEKGASADYSSTRKTPRF